MITASIDLSPIQLVELLVHLGLGAAVRFPNQFGGCVAPLVPDVADGGYPRVVLAAEFDALFEKLRAAAARTDNSDPHQVVGALRGQSGPGRGTNKISTVHGKR